MQALRCCMLQCKVETREIRSDAQHENTCKQANKRHLRTAFVSTECMRMALVGLDRAVSAAVHMW